ncbi:hypothetical protein [Bradyrhizobium sp. LHD-71]|uniref:hypothetical protein n=1 Tax=Bradyrhizobium sp. LHD-71 TaxID=3072141 RepID=UPI0028100317|nr:hypothetical protein [Bradyrhizobium sp. LHD-71]MDQ8729892.1 hypothetical protein [Bradyrhizobium sp. LHD-71]
MQGPRLRVAIALFAVQPLLAGCGSVDFSLKDQEWFRRPAMFSRSLTIETPPLSNTRAVSAADLISAEGHCAGMASPADASALAETTQSIDPTQAGAGVAIGRTECEVARAAGAPDNVAISNERGQRVTVLTYVRGPRPGIYRFADGRMVSMERAAEPEPPARNPRGSRAKRQG